MTNVTKINSTDFVAIKAALDAGKAVVTFTKKDGTSRVMTCTTNSALIPATDTPAGTSTRAQNPNVIPVYDLETGAWRSFRWDSVTSAEAIDG